jgi:hypothetical protein
MADRRSVLLEQQNKAKQTSGGGKGSTSNPMLAESLQDKAKREGRKNIWKDRAQRMKGKSGSKASPAGNRSWGGGSWNDPGYTDPKAPPRGSGGRAAPLRPEIPGRKAAAPPEKPGRAVTVPAPAKRTGGGASRPAVAPPEKPTPLTAMSSRYGTAARTEAKAGASKPKDDRTKKWVEKMRNSEGPAGGR